MTTQDLPQETTADGDNILIPFFDCHRTLARRLRGEALRASAEAPELRMLMKPKGDHADYQSKRVAPEVIDQMRMSLATSIVAQCAHYRTESICSAPHHEAIHFALARKPLAEVSEDGEEFGDTRDLLTLITDPGSGNTPPTTYEEADRQAKQRSDHLDAMLVYFASFLRVSLEARELTLDPLLEWVLVGEQRRLID